MPPLVTHTRLAPSRANSHYLQRTDTGQPWSQVKQRGDGFYTDEHGREWYAPTELKTNAPCGPIEPVEWTAPLMPPQKYLRVGHDRRRPTELVILYDQWIDDEGTAREQWLRNGRIASRAMHGDKYDEHASFSRDVIELIGPEPGILIPAIEAAEQGNPWVLGFVPTPDRRLYKLFELDAKKKKRFRSSVDYSKVEKLDPIEALEEDFDPEANGRQNGRPPRTRGRDGQLSQTPEARRKRAEREKKKGERQGRGAAAIEAAQRDQPPAPPAAPPADVGMGDGAQGAAAGGEGSQGSTATTGDGYEPART